MPKIFEDAQSAMGFVVSQTVNIEQEVYRIKYPDFDYGALVPVVTEGNQWASGTLFYTMDTVGKTEWLADQSSDVPHTDLLRGSGSHTFYMRGGAYRWTLPEINQASMQGIALSAEKASGTRRAMEQFLYGLAMSGDDEKSMKGLINQTGVTAAVVPANGTGTVTWWANKSVDNILKDVNDYINTVWAATNYIELPDTMLLPPTVFADIATRRISSGGDGAMTILDYLRQKNVYTAITGRPFTIRPLRDLDTASAGGNGRGIIYRNAREVIRFHMPMMFMFLPVFQKNSLTWEQVGIVRTGGVEVRLPKAMIYMDGILDSAGT